MEDGPLHGKVPLTLDAVQKDETRRFFWLQTTATVDPALPAAGTENTLLYSRTIPPNAARPKSKILNLIPSSAGSRCSASRVRMFADWLQWRAQLRTACSLHIKGYKGHQFVSRESAEMALHIRIP